MAKRPTSPNGNGSAKGTTGCVLLVRQGQRPPAGLIAGLEQRGASAVTVNNLPDTMVALAQHRATVLVVIDADRWHALPQLIAAVRRYHPRVRLWRFEWNETTRKASLTRLTNGLPNHKPPANVSPPPPEGSNAQVPLPKHAARAQPQHMPEPLITQDELAMLIGPADP